VRASEAGRGSVAGDLSGARAYLRHSRAGPYFGRFFTPPRHGENRTTGPGCNCPRGGLVEPENTGRS